MPQWDIDFDLIPVNADDTKKREILKARGLDGWEPYAIVGITHYYKRIVVVAAPEHNPFPNGFRLGDLESKQTKKKK